MSKLNKFKFPPFLTVYLVEPAQKELSKLLEHDIQCPTDTLSTIADGVRVARVGSICEPIIKKYCTKKVISVVKINKYRFLSMERICRVRRRSRRRWSLFGPDSRLLILLNFWIIDWFFAATCRANRRFGSCRCALSQTGTCQKSTGYSVRRQCRHWFCYLINEFSGFLVFRKKIEWESALHCTFLVFLDFSANS